MNIYYLYMYEYIPLHIYTTYICISLYTTIYTHVYIHVCTYVFGGVRIYTHMCGERLSGNLLWHRSLCKMWPVAKLCWWSFGHCPALMFERTATTVGEGGVLIPVIPEVSLESDSESDVSEDSEVFSGRWGSCAMSIGVSLYSGLLQGGSHSSGVRTPVPYGLLLTIFSPLPCPNLWSLESLNN